MHLLGAKITKYNMKIAGREFIFGVRAPNGKEQWVSASSSVEMSNWVREIDKINVKPNSCTLLLTGWLKGCSSSGSGEIHQGKRKKRKPNSKVVSFCI